ncbi:hypothetical protein [Geobacillus thermocatenulatus]
MRLRSIAGCKGKGGSNLDESLFSWAHQQSVNLRGWIIFHIDRNSFFASCEIARDPSLHGKPIVVAGGAKKVEGIVLRPVMRRNSNSKRRGGSVPASSLLRCFRLFE